MSIFDTATGARSVLPVHGSAMGVAADAVVMTADGAICATYLEAGDRIVTRRGMRVIRAVLRRPWPATLRPVLVLPAALGGKPDRACILPATQRVLIRDWRARALWNRPAVCPAISRLVDGTFVRWSATRPTELVQIHLGQPEILYVDGLELASADPVRATA
jgi:hypothetical protein